MKIGVFENFPASFFFALALALTNTVSPAADVPENAAQQFAAVAAESRKQGGSSLLIAENGRIVFSEFASGFGMETRGPVLSITKTLVAITAWQLQGKGRLSLQDPVVKILPSWKNHAAQLADLLNFSAGLADGRSVFYRKHVKNKRALAAKQKPIRDAGLDFVYGPASYEIFGEVLTRVLGGDSGAVGAQAPLAFMQKRLLSPLRASAAMWRMTDEGTPYFSTGAWMSPAQLFALGELIRKDGGMGWRRIFPKGFLRELQTDSSGFPLFHLGVWRNLAAGKPGCTEVNIEASIGDFTDRDWWANRCISHRAPADLLALVGSGGQRVYIIPSRKLVIVRTGNLRGKAFDDAKFLAAIF